MTIQQLNEEAFLKYLREYGLETVEKTRIYKGVSSPDGGYEDSETTMKLPCILITSDQGTVFATPSRNERGTVRVHVRTQRDDEKEKAHRERCAEVFAALSVTDLATQLSYLSGYCCEYVRVLGSGLDSKTGRHLETVLELEVFSVDADLT